MGKALIVERLQQVVKRMNVESLQSILIERGNKDDRLDLFRSDLCEHVEAVHLGHLDVEKDQIGRQGVNSLDCFAPVPTLVDRKSTRLNSSHIPLSRMPSSA